MEYKYQYSTQEERNSLLTMHSSLILIEEQNITEGNFLVFSDTPIPTEIVYTNIPQEELDSIKNQVASLNIAMAEMLGV